MRDLATLYRALGDETRLRMLCLLLGHRELCVCDFMEVLGVTQSKASRHLRTLFHAGLVDDRRAGLWVYYTLRKPDEPLIRVTLRALRASLAERAEAEPLRQSLAAWLARKQGGKRCAM